MDKLAFLLTYKGLVVLGALAVLLVAERLLPVAKAVGGVRRVARTCRSAGSTPCSPGRWWCPSRHSPPPMRWTGGRSGGAAGRAFSSTSCCSTAGSTGGTAPTMNGPCSGASMKFIIWMSFWTQVPLFASILAKCCCPRWCVRGSSCCSACRSSASWCSRRCWRSPPCSTTPTSACRPGWSGRCPF